MSPPVPHWPHSPTGVGCSPRTLQRRFTPFWLIDIPEPTTGHTGRVYDHIFLDGTYTAGGCFIIAASIDHVIAWRWCTRETTSDYRRLIEPIPAPPIAVIDGGRGSPPRSQRAGQKQKSSAALSTPNGWSAATPPPGPVPMPGVSSTGWR